MTTRIAGIDFFHLPMLMYHHSGKGLPANHPIVKTTSRLILPPSRIIFRQVLGAMGHRHRHGRINACRLSTRTHGRVCRRRCPHEAPPSPQIRRLTSHPRCENPGRSHRHSRTTSRKPCPIRMMSSTCPHRWPEDGHTLRTLPEADLNLWPPPGL